MEEVVVECEEPALRGDCGCGNQAVYGAAEMPARRQVLAICAAETLAKRQAALARLSCRRFAKDEFAGRDVLDVRHPA